MREFPLIFTPDSVNSMIDGDKTNSRRVAKGLPPFIQFSNPLDGLPWCDEDGKWYYKWQDAADNSTIYELKCPYGKKGDIIWVREPWAWNEGFAGSGIYEFKADFFQDSRGWLRRKGTHDRYICKWRNPRYMPKEAARIWLKLTEDPWIQPLQDMKSDDFFKEGITLKMLKGCDPLIPIGEHLQQEFINRWDKINKKPGTTYGENPWVWVLEYQVLSTTGRPESFSIN